MQVSLALLLSKQYPLANLFCQIIPGLLLENCHLLGCLRLPGKLPVLLYPSPLPHWEANGVLQVADLGTLREFYYYFFCIFVSFCFFVFVFFKACTGPLEICPVNTKTP